MRLAEPVLDGDLDELALELDGDSVVLASAVDVSVDVVEADIDSSLPGNIVTSNILTCGRHSLACWSTKSFTTDGGLGEDQSSDAMPRYFLQSSGIWVHSVWTQDPMDRAATTSSSSRLPH